MNLRREAVERDQEVSRIASEWSDFFNFGVLSMSTQLQTARLGEISEEVKYVAGIENVSIALALIIQCYKQICIPMEVYEIE